MTFTSRTEAGQRLGAHLAEQDVQADVVLGLPRGGVIVAAEVARILKCPLDVLVVRKIGHPGHREFAVGALAEDGTVVLDQAVIERSGVSPGALEKVLAEETARLAEYQARFLRPNRPSLEGRTVLIVDDGLATGATTEAAVRSARNRGAARIIVAAPVASDNAVQRLERGADKVMALMVDPEFDAVGRYYLSFPQTTDEEVRAILATCGQETEPHRPPSRPDAGPFRGNQDDS
jgi:predicted phosphoribosyltransferase